jgi:hypothetical protein
MLTYTDIITISRCQKSKTRDHNDSETQGGKQTIAQRKPFKLTFSKTSCKTAHSKVSAPSHKPQRIMHNCAVVHYFHYMVNQSSLLAMPYTNSLISFHVLDSTTATYFECTKYCYLYYWFFLPSTVLSIPQYYLSSLFLGLHHLKQIIHSIL